MQDKPGYKSPLSRRRLMVASVVGVFAFSRAHAQAWPAKQIRVIAPYPPGGGVDTVARAFSEKVSAKWRSTAPAVAKFPRCA